MADRQRPAVPAAGHRRSPTPIERPTRAPAAGRTCGARPVGGAGHRVDRGGVGMGEPPGIRAGGPAPETAAVRFTIAPPAGTPSPRRTTCRWRCRRMAAPSSTSRPGPMASGDCGCTPWSGDRAVGPAGHRRRQHTVLVARQPVGRLLCRRQPQADPPLDGHRPGRRHRRLDVRRRAWSPRTSSCFRPAPAGLSRVDVNGGTTSPVTRGEGHFWPQFLPDGEHFIYAAAAPAGSWSPRSAPDPPRTLMPFPLRSRPSAMRRVTSSTSRIACSSRGRSTQARLAFSGEAVHVLDGVPVVGQRPGAVRGLRRGCAGVLAASHRRAGGPAVVRARRPGDGRRRLAGAVSGLRALAGRSASSCSRAMDANGGADLWVRDIGRRHASGS